MRQAIQAFDFESLFLEELGWDHPPASRSVEVSDRLYELEAVADKSGMVAFLHRADAIPDRALRMKIERQLAKSVYEHLIVFADKANTEQVWQWVRRQPGQPPRYRENSYRREDAGEPLVQKLRHLAFSLDEDPSTSEVTGRARRAFDVDRVTRRFYDKFKAEHKAFQKFLEDAIPVRKDREIYTSVMLDRIMFVYFIQKKGFLDDDSDYLRTRLTSVQELRGQDQFISFYRHFLRRFFHEGLGQPMPDRDPGLEALIGKVPYVNGGIFDVHEIEEKYCHIQIDDLAFENLFDFFDAYQWHLDERPLRNDSEINPDVLGYIFERYVNQKQMGAYYTKDDITGYIAQSTIIPRLFDIARKHCAIAFQYDSALWGLLGEDPDRYIYPSVRKGVDLPLPDVIAAGLHDVSLRGRWNDTADDALALPTETWRELVARRQRYEEVWEKLVAGEVHHVNDLITLNLDIRQFAQDVILDCEGPDLLRAFWKAINGVSVLDPACGSGAFLFAALNVLEPLYDACLERMEAFLDELDHSGAEHSPAKFSDFRRHLAEVESHPNRRYYVLKSIVIGNLYGVDIMEEAVEICKLRLFLKLAAQAATVDELEPLPDIDFNIRAGNTLVGFTSLDAVRHAITVTPEGQHRQLFTEEQAVLSRIEEEAAIASAAFNQFQQQQIVLGGEVTTVDKGNLRQRLRNLSDTLDRYLASEYKVEVDDSEAYARWRTSHDPFHWFVEFYGIVHDGGFDVVIGNPPYVAKSRVLQSYVPKGFRTSDCPDIYASVVERSVGVCRANGRTAMIVPLSLTFRNQFTALRALLREQCAANWFSSFGRIPSALFSFDTRVRNTIWLGWKSPRKTSASFTTRLHRWFSVQRPTLFENLTYTQFSADAFDGKIPKLGSSRLLRGFESIQRDKYRLRNTLTQRKTGIPLHFKKAAYNWLTSCVDLPPAYDEYGRPLTDKNYGTLYFDTKESRDLAAMLTNGKILFLWWLAMGDDFNVPQRHYSSAPLGLSHIPSKSKVEMLDLLPSLVRAMGENIDFKLMAGKTIGNYNLARCRHITDVTDKLWLEAMNLGELWDDIELEHSLVVRTSFDEV
ncbi:MAG: Eco57I restriction-modification methylase domain-containing protein [Chloroflexi bacterium]|nr:Eco57I restriction-modification methylase domain-containing protein [Chloroflexota bacterium]